MKVTVVAPCERWSLRAGSGPDPADHRVDQHRERPLARRTRPVRCRICTEGSGTGGNLTSVVPGGPDTISDDRSCIKVNRMGSQRGSGGTRGTAAFLWFLWSLCVKRLLSVFR